MRISCPQCKTSYEINSDIIPLQGKKVRCANCGEIWKIYPQDLENFRSTLDKDTAKEDITNHVEPETTEKKKVKESCFFLSLLKIILTLLFILAIISAYVFRYQIVRNFPETESIYNKLGIEAKIIGEGLVFENVMWEEYEDNYIRKMDISGTIINETEKLLNVPLLHIELIDSDGNTLQNVDRTLSSDHIVAGGSINFKTTIVRPAPFTKYIFITFTKSN